MAGEWLGKFMLEQGWDDAVMVLGTTDSPLEPLVERDRGCKEGFLSVVDVPEDRIFELGMPAPALTEEGYNTMTDWLTAHPQYEHIISCGTNDQRATGVSTACEAAGLTETCAVVGMGVDAPALSELQERTDEQSSFKGSVGFFPEFYGKYLLPMLVDLIEGNAVPDEVYLDHFVIDRSNIDEYYPQEGEPAEEVAYVAEIRPAKERWRIGFADGMAELDFTSRVAKNIHEAADKMGVEIAVECDNAYDVEKTMSCMETIIAADVDGILLANWHSEIADEYSKLWLDAGIPAVTYDGPHPGTPDFGASNYDAGFVAGVWLGEYIVDQGWDDAVLVIGTTDTPLEALLDRDRGCREGLLSVVDMPDDRIYELGMTTPALVEESYNAMTDWLTAHPEAEHIVMCGSADERATGASSACEAAGMAQTCATIGQGCFAPALEELRGRTDEESAFKASVGYFPEFYGNYLVPMIVDLIEGNPVPDSVRLDHFAIDRSNVLEYYPEE